ncbi:MAG: peptidoglycan DD-metalloendopeptidase family protein [Gammaproteobacteria bacterium]|nr:peptidoglycan DD-metalloendopeptidase family protein [Gammaproteobacteria bacterium]
MRARTIVVILICLLSPLAHAQSKQQQTERQLEVVKQRIQALNQQLSGARDEADAAQRQLRASERAIGQVASKLHELQAQRHDQEQRLAGLDDERATLRSDIEQNQDALVAQVQAAYAMGQQPKLKLLLSQRDPATISRTIVYYDYINRARARHLNAIRADLDELGKVEARIRWETERLTGLEREARERERELDKERHQRRILVARLRKQLEEQGGQLAGLEKDQERLQEVLKALDRVLADIPDNAGTPQSLARMQGRLGWPVAGSRRVAFGTPRPNGGPTWKGVIIDARQGTDVRAIHAGRVAFADWLRGMGLLIIIDHGDGDLSLYGHNESLYREAGEWVEAGDLVARVGDSGGQERAGLYFELRRNGQPVDPVSWCRKDGKAIVSGG